MTEGIRVFVGAHHDPDNQAIEIYGELTQLKGTDWEWVGDLKGIALPLEAITEGVPAEVTLNRAQELVKHAIEELSKSHPDVVEDDWQQNFWVN